MPTIKRLKYTIGGPEVTPGLAVARQFVLPIRALPGLDKAVQREADPAIIGTNMLAGEYPTADSIEGGIPLTPRPCGGFGQILKSLMGTEAAPVQIAACIRMRYIGADASSKIVADGAGDTLKSYKGALGAEVADAAFGAAGSMDLTSMPYDTVGEIVAAIDGYADYACKKIFGDDATVSANIVSATRQAKSKWVYLWFTGVTGGVYLHQFTPDISDTERPVYTTQADGLQSNFLRPGCVVNQLTLQAALKTTLQGEAQIMGMTETDGEGASALVLEDVDPLIFHKGDLSMGAVEYTYTRKMDLTLGNNHVGDAGYGFGSASRQAHQKGEFTGTGSLQVRLDASSYAERAKLSTGLTVALSYYFYGSDYVTGIPQLMLVELPYCTISAGSFTENNGVIDITLEIKVLNPKGTLYDAPVTISILTKDSGAY